MTTDTFTTGSAMAAVTSPWWLLIIHGVSTSCALILPVLGVILLVTQLVDRFDRKRNKN